MPLLGFSLYLLNPDGQGSALGIGMRQLEDH